MVNLGEHTHSDSSESEEGAYLFDSEFSPSDAEELDGYESDDSVTHYPYSPEAMGKARPFFVEVQIHGELVEAVVDTRASVPVISKPLSDRLGLKMNDDLMSIQQLDESDSKASGVCVDVPLRIGGKLQCEHCTVLDRRSDIWKMGIGLSRS